MSLKESLKNLFTSKNLFLNFFAFYAFTGAMIIAALLIFTKIPQDNQRLADIFFGSILTAVIGTIMNYKFGSSASSKAKDDVLQDYIAKKPEGEAK
jgi:hypothetical protein